MRFFLVDRIEALEPARRIVAVKNLTLAEEYLQDHFPTFPVMPGVLMLEALAQAGAWLWRITSNFSHSIVVLREAKGVKYGNFVEPGKRLVLFVEAVDNLEENAQTATFKGNGEIDGTIAVSARFTLGRYNLRERFPECAALDEEILADFRRRYLALKPPATGIQTA